MHQFPRDFFRDSAKVWCILDLLLIIGIDGNAVIEASLSGSSIFLQKLRLSEVRATSWCCKRWCEMIQIWTLCGGLWFIFSKVCRCYKLFLITPSSQRNDVGEADERFVAYVFVSTSFISSVKIAHSRTLHRRKFITQMHFSGKWGQPTRLCAALAAEKKRKLCSLASKNMNLFCTFNENHKKIYEIDNTPRLVWSWQNWH